MNALKLILGLGLFLIFLALAVSIPYDITLFDRVLTSDAVDLLRLALVVFGFVAVFAGVMEK
jgi:hypothetical protein